jgi:hypothetical protein
MELVFNMWLDMFMYPTYLLQSFSVSGFRAFQCSSQKLLSVEGQSIFVNMSIFYLPFDTIVIRSPLTRVFISPHFISSFVLKSLGIPFGFGVTVPWHCMVLVNKLLY